MSRSRSVAFGSTVLGTTTVSQGGTTSTVTGLTLTAPITTYSINVQTTSYTLVASDAAAVITTGVGSANTISIPTNASVPFAIGTTITILQYGSGQTTIQAANSGTTSVLSTGATSNAPKIRTQYAGATCIKTGTDQWSVVGDIS